MIFTTAQVREMVNRGFRVLTREQRDMVDVDKLYMPSGELCVLGQAFPGEDFDDVLERLFGCTGDECDQQAEGHGFYVQKYEDIYTNYAALQREWIRRLELERDISEIEKLLEPVGSF